MNTKFRELLLAVAPTLATAFGGPLAGVATRAVGDKLLGKPDASFEEVTQTILAAGTGELAKLKELELEFQAKLQEAGIELERIASSDRDSARDRQVRMRDWSPTFLGLAIIAGFFGMMAYLVQYGLPQEGGEVLLIMMGALATMTTQVGNYFFGSSTGSKAKDNIIADLKGALN